MDYNFVTLSDVEYLSYIYHHQKKTTGILLFD